MGQRGFEHKLELVDFTPRQYQADIVRTCLDNNTLVVIPTGIGKTFIALLLAYERLKKYPDSKVLITAPTKPLCNQHVQTFMKHTDLKDQVVLFTGSTPSSQPPRPSSQFLSTTGFP